MAALLQAVKCVMDGTCHESSQLHVAVRPSVPVVFFRPFDDTSIGHRSKLLLDSRQRAVAVRFPIRHLQYGRGRQYCQSSILIYKRCKRTGTKVRRGHECGLGAFNH